MSKTIEVPYDCGDYVWVMRNNRPEPARIIAVSRSVYGNEVYHSFDIDFYRDPSGSGERTECWLPEGKVAPDKETLMKIVFDL